MADLNFKHLRYFWAVAHDGNLTRTAERLNLSQSAVSVQIKQLEERLGHALFERQGRQLQLTEAGRIALDHADAIFATGDELLSSLRDSGRSRRIVRIGALATLSRNFQIAFLRPLLGLDEVEVILRSGSTAELLRELESLNLDIALMNRPPARDAARAFVSQRLAEQGVVLVGRPERAGSEKPLKEILTEQPVILPTAESEIRVGFDALADRLGLRPQIAAEVDDMAMMRLLTREGIGLGVLPPIVVKDELESGHLIAVDPLPGIVELFYAVTLERRFPSPFMRTLLERAQGGLLAQQ